jgi:hypothetical protein
VCPGLMRTGSHPNAFFKGQHEKEYAWFAISDASPLLSTSAEKAARQIVEACRYGDARLTITPQARLLDLAATLFPSLTAAGQALAVRLLPGADAAAGDRRQTGWESPSALAPSVLTGPGPAARAACAHQASGVSVTVAVSGRWSENRKRSNAALPPIVKCSLKKRWSSARAGFQAG